jgi:AraC family transcriptional regulator
MPARMCSMSGEIDLAHTNVRVLDYRWNAQERIHEQDDVFILRYRPFPAQVSLSAHFRDGHVQDFGQLMFFPAQVEINTTPAKEGELTRNVMCSFSRSKFVEIWPEQCDWSEELERCLDMRNPRIEQAMQRLGLEAACPGFASHLMADTLAQLIALEVARHFNDRKSTQRVRTFDGQFSASELGRVYDFVDSVTNRSPSVTEIADMCGISSAHLRRAFKHTTGMTLHDYVTNSRLRKAQALLLDTDLPLKEVAFRLGFASCSTFSSTFRRESGETPSGYRQRIVNRTLVGSSGRLH